MEEMVDIKLSDGTVVTIRPLKVGDLISNKAQDPEIRNIKLVASAVVKVNGEKKKVDPIADVSEWPLGDFVKVQSKLMEISGLSESDLEIKK